MNKVLLKSFCLAMILSLSGVFANEVFAEAETLAGIGSHGAEDGKEAQFNMPIGIISGLDGKILVADTFNSLIRAVDPDGYVSSLSLHFPEPDARGFPFGGFRDGELSGALFNRPSGFALGFGNWFFVADTNNHAVRVIIGDRVYTMAGGRGEGFTDGARQVAQFSFPSAVAVSPNGLIYVADTGNHVIRRIYHDGAVTTIAGEAGEHGYRNGAINTALFDSPVGLQFCDEGRLFVADMGNHVVRIIENGIVSTYAGIRAELVGAEFDEWDGASAGGFHDGGAAYAAFNNPMSLAFWQGILFVADSGNHKIRAVFGGEVMTVAGTGYPGYLDGDLAGAMFHLPSGLYVFGTNLFVADTGNNMIRTIDLIAVLDMLGL